MAESTPDGGPEGAGINRIRVALHGARKILVVEQSQSEQLYHYLKAHYDLGAKMRSFRHPGPMPIVPADVLERIMEWR